MEYIESTLCKMFIGLLAGIALSVLFADELNLGMSQSESRIAKKSPYRDFSSTEGKPADKYLPNDPSRGPEISFPSNTPGQSQNMGQKIQKINSLDYGSQSVRRMGEGYSVASTEDKATRLKGIRGYKNYPRQLYPELEPIDSLFEQEQKPMTTGIESIRAAILEQLNPIEKESAELEARLEGLSQEKNQLKEALGALEPPKKAKSKATAKAKKPSPKQKEVREVAMALVAENPAIDKADLEELTKQKLKAELGLDLKGFDMRWSEVMSSGTFVITSDNQVTLPSPEAEDSDVSSSGNIAESPVENVSKSK